MIHYYSVRRKANMFIPLHINSEYSFLKSGLKLDNLFSFIKKNNYATALGISDISHIHGLPRFYQLANMHEISPIGGMDILIAGHVFSIFLTNDDSYYDLIHIANLQSSSNMNVADFFNLAHSLIVIISVNTSTDLNSDELIEIIQIFKQHKYFYIGVEIYEGDDSESVNAIRAFAARNMLKTIAFPHIKYLKKDDALILDIATAIANDEILTHKNNSGKHFLPNEEEISSIYENAEITACQEVLSLSSFRFKKASNHILKFDESRDSKQLLHELCMDFLIKQNLNNNVYLERLNYELNVINEMNYNDYFLIVNDYVKFAKNHDITVGPGRGSAAGSLVSYSLNITTVDPIKNKLIFERFLNPKRKSLPDIDIDFEDTRRDEVVTYLKNKYGKQRVANIVTYQTIGVKQAIRDIGRVFAYPQHEIDYLSKLLGNLQTNFKDAYRNNLAFKQLLDTEPHYLEIVTLANKIEGLIRQTGLHAAGIILSDTNLFDTLPVLSDDSSNLTTQYEMHYLEDQGFLKMDLLALRNLTIIKKCLQLADCEFGIYDIPYDNQLAIDIIRNNLVSGIFQLESSGIRNAIKILQPSTFEDIVALLALYRPGPMDMIEEYAKRKCGTVEPTYENDVLKNILEPTYGIIIYQEQIMQIVVEMAGFSLAEADIFRRAISKKDALVLLEQKSHFVQGAIARGYKEEIASNVFAHIEKFANYGFNRAHSVSYAVITCQMAYLKATFPLAFYASILGSESGFTNVKINDFLQEMKKQNVSLLAPDINTSQLTFLPLNNGLVFPLSAIKGFQRQVAESIITERDKNGDYIDFFNFVSRNKEINELNLMKLINAGAFDRFNNRATLRASINNALMNAKVSHEMSKFLHYEMIPAIDDSLTNLNLEYETMGLMISGSILKEKSSLINAIKHTPISEVSLINGSTTIIGIVKNIKIIRTKKGEQMGYITICDDDHEIETTVFPNVFQKIHHLLKQNIIIVVNGFYKIQPRDGFIVDDIRLLEEK